MIFDLPPEVQMAIRLRAVKLNITHGEVICLLIEEVFPVELAEARKALLTKSKEQLDV